HRSRLLLVSLFFFFQAEDGIRDFHVTGVQTCALPISAQHRTQLGEQHHERERFDQVAVRAQIQSVRLVDLPVLGRHQQHRCPYALGPQLLQHPVTAQPGKHDVQQHGVEGPRAREPQRRRSVARGHHVHPLGAQAAIERLAHPRLVVDDQYPRLHAPTIPERSSGWANSQHHLSSSGRSQASGWSVSGERARLVADKGDDMQPRTKGLVAAVTGAALGVTGLALVAMPAGADDAPNLPEISAQELVSSTLQADPPAFAGSVAVHNDLGLPSGVPGMDFADFDSARVFHDGDDGFRVSVQDGNAEYTLVANGDEAWAYNSSDNTATRFAAPDGDKTREQERAK